MSKVDSIWFGDLTYRLKSESESKKKKKEGIYNKSQVLVMDYQGYAINKTENKGQDLEIVFQERRAQF